MLTINGQRGDPATEEHPQSMSAFTFPMHVCRTFDSGNATFERSLACVISVTAPAKRTALWPYHQKIPPVLWGENSFESFE